MFNWPALTLSVQNQWGGADSKGRREWFAGAISEMFTERPQTDLEDVETTLLQVMLDEFEINVDDETAFDVAEQIMRVRAATLKGDFTEVDSMYAAWLAKKGNDEVQIRFVERDEDVDETDGSLDSEENENEDTEMEEAPVFGRPIRAKPTPEVDEEGFTTVVGRKGKR